MAPLVLILGLGAIGGEIAGAWPHATEVRFDFGPDHGAIRAARIAYLLDGDEAAGVRFEWAAGAPEAFRHTIDLEPGRYAVIADLEGTEGTEGASLEGQDAARHARVERALVVPAEGVVRIALFDEARQSSSGRLASPFRFFDEVRVAHARRTP